MSLHPQAEALLAQIAELGDAAATLAQAFG